MEIIKTLHLKDMCIIDPDNPIQFSFRCPPKCTNVIYSHGSHTEFMNRIDVSLLLNGSKEIIKILCFVSGILINVSFYIMFIWVLFCCFRTCAVQYVFLGMKTDKAPWWILLQTGNIILLISVAIYKEIKTVLAECLKFLTCQDVGWWGEGEWHSFLRFWNNHCEKSVKRKSHLRYSDCIDLESRSCSCLFQLDCKANKWITQQQVVEENNLTFSQWNCISVRAFRELTNLPELLEMFFNFGI